MTEGSPAMLSIVRPIPLTALGLAAAGAWLAALDAAWNRWNALALGPICGETTDWTLLPGHCVACPTAVILTVLLALTVAARRRPAPRDLSRSPTFTRRPAALGQERGRDCTCAT